MGSCIVTTNQRYLKKGGKERENQCIKPRIYEISFKHEVQNEL